MENIHLIINNDDRPFLPLLKPFLDGKAKVSLSNLNPLVPMHAVMEAGGRGSKLIASTNLKLLTDLSGNPKATLDDYAGSIFSQGDAEILILNPLEHLATRAYGSFLYERYFSKFMRKSDWLQIPEFQWELFEPSQSSRLQSLFSRATFIAADIETGEEADRVITCIGFTAVEFNTGSKSFTATTVVIPFGSLFNIAFARTILGLSVPKVFQNGKYDCAYLLRFNSLPTNWCFDTQHMFHAWYSEFPKRLDFLCSFMLRKWIFHKSESKTDDLGKYYAYNAKDSFSTAMIWLALLRECPDWAWRNYIAEFPQVFPCLLAELQGMKVSVETQKALQAQVSTRSDEDLVKLQTMVDNKFYNPGSWQQTAKLWIILGSEDIKKTGKIPRDKVASRHPINRRICNLIKVIREDRKIESSYSGKEITWDEHYHRVFYALNPHATDTGRYGSKESAFWCGLQIQNIPRKPANKSDIPVKRMFVTDDGFLYGEADYSQNEARGTGYLSGDLALIKAVEDRTRDFHGHNASAFFGVPYDTIIRSVEESGVWGHTVIDEELRDLSKRTNHGSNYNMGAAVLLDTMGIENVIRARTLLGLPSTLSLLGVCQYLLDGYAATYPIVKGPWYDKVKADVASTRMLVGPTGWTRYCFSDPSKSKLALNGYVAHPPQSLAAQVLNKAWLSVFYNVWMPNKKDFKLHAQIHDSILFQYREGREDLAWKVAECMDISTEVKDTFGITRILRVPVDLKGNGLTWHDMIKLKRPLELAA